MGLLLPCFGFQLEVLTKAVAEVDAAFNISRNIPNVDFFASIPCVIEEEACYQQECLPLLPGFGLLALSEDDVNYRQVFIVDLVCRHNFVNYLQDYRELEVLRNEEVNLSVDDGK